MDHSYFNYKCFTILIRGCVKTMTTFPRRALYRFRERAAAKNKEKLTEPQQQQQQRQHRQHARLTVMRTFLSVADKGNGER